MREDEHRRVEGRVLAPPAAPGGIPRAVAAAEHPAPHDVRAGARERLLGDPRVIVGRRPAGSPEEPLVQALAALPERVLEALVRSGGEAVEGHGDLARDARHALIDPRGARDSSAVAAGQGRARARAMKRRWRSTFVYTVGNCGCPQPSP